MSSENLAAVRRYVDAFNRLDVAAAHQALIRRSSFGNGRRRRAPRPITVSTAFAVHSTRGSRPGSG